MKKYYTFNDVFLIPQFSDCESRSLLDTSSKIGSISLDVPIISANMDTVTGPEMAIAMAQSGAVGALHRFNSTAEAVEEYKKVVDAGHDCFVSIGVGHDSLQRAIALKEVGASNFS